MFVFLPKKTPNMNDGPRCENTMVAPLNVCNGNAFHILSGEYSCIQYS
jgi:hypothetical protein